MADTLKPCPWCGKLPEYVRAERDFATLDEALMADPDVKCRTPKCPVRFFPTAMTVDEWNTRTMDDAPDARPDGPICGENIAPVGWWCSRPVGHEGPCAAHEKTDANPLLIAEGALRTARHAILRQCDTFKAEGEITTALWHIRAALSQPKEEVEAMRWLGDNVSLELTWGEIGNDPSEAAWRVHSSRGGYNDREWDLVATGETPLEALTNARAALAPKERSE